MTLRFNLTGEQSERDLERLLAEKNRREERRSEERVKESREEDEWGEETRRKETKEKLLKVGFVWEREILLKIYYCVKVPTLTDTSHKLTWWHRCHGNMCIPLNGRRPVWQQVQWLAGCRGRTKGSVWHCSGGEGWEDGWTTAERNVYRNIKESSLEHFLNFYTSSANYNRSVSTRGQPFCCGPNIIFCMFTWISFSIIFSIHICTQHNNNQTNQSSLKLWAFCPVKGCMICKWSWLGK